MLAEFSGYSLMKRISCQQHGSSIQETAGTAMMRLLSRNSKGLCYDDINARNSLLYVADSESTGNMLLRYSLNRDTS
jgi:hypothetical protein